MKATKYIKTIILTAIFCLQAGTIFADGTDAKLTANYSEATSVTLMYLAPTTPSEATFEEVSLINVIADLAPVTPTEATFEDAASEMVSNFELAPGTPTVADFEDDIIVMTVDNENLAPVTPFEADFE